MVSSPTPLLPPSRFFIYCVSRCNFVFQVKISPLSYSTVRSQNNKGDTKIYLRGWPRVQHSTNKLPPMYVSATDQNPKTWPPAVPIARDKPPYPVLSVDPSRRLSEDRGTSSLGSISGSYLPLSGDPRACMSIFFVRAQICAGLLALLKDYYEIRHRW